MKLESKLKLIHGLFWAASISVVAVIGVMLLDGWINSPAAHQVRTTKTPRVQEQEKPKAKQEAPPAAAPVTQYTDVNEYFSAGNPNPLSHRFGLPRYERDVSRLLKKKIKERDGNCCLWFNSGSRSGAPSGIDEQWGQFRKQSFDVVRPLPRQENASRLVDQKTTS